MALNTKDPVTVRLAAEVAALTGESTTMAVRTALEERVAPDVRGAQTSKAERGEILGIGPEGR